jgi:hypothetical protein
MAFNKDNCLIIVTDETTDEAIESLEGHEFGLKVEDQLTDYLSFRSSRNLKKKILNHGTSFDSIWRSSMDAGLFQSFHINPQDSETDC